MYLFYWRPTEAQLPGLFLPLAIALYLWYKSIAKGFDAKMFLVFLIATAANVYFSHWVVTADSIQVHSYPVCALTLILMGLLPGVSWPDAALGFNMVFFSELILDVLRGLPYAQAHHIENIFAGIGGDGFIDGLLVFPLLTALGLLILNNAPAIEQRVFHKPLLKLR